jgi:hypothetical protein
MEENQVTASPFSRLIRINGELAVSGCVPHFVRASKKQRFSKLFWYNRRGCSAAVGRYGLFAVFWRRALLAMAKSV